MPAYVIVDVRISDPVTYEEYKRMVPPSMAVYGGKFIARGGKLLDLEGDWNPERVVMLEFPSLEKQRRGTTRQNTLLRKR